MSSEKRAPLSFGNNNELEFDRHKFVSHRYVEFVQRQNIFLCSSLLYNLKSNLHYAVAVQRLLGRIDKT